MCKIFKCIQSKNIASHPYKTTIINTNTTNKKQYINLL